jgi:hypothetical protein
MSQHNINRQTNKTPLSFGEGLGVRHYCHVRCPHDSFYHSLIVIEAFATHEVTRIYCRECQAYISKPK